jgi:hypothetical protein
MCMLGRYLGTHALDIEKSVAAELVNVFGSTRAPILPPPSSIPYPVAKMLKILGDPIIDQQLLAVGDCRVQELSGMSCVWTEQEWEMYSSARENGRNRCCSRTAVRDG